MDDPFDLARFVSAQAGVYERALGELRAGRKRSHWMWFIFPQLRGLGSSATSNFYGLGSIDEADAYAGHPILGKRLRACTRAMLGHSDWSAAEILGQVDGAKFHSSMTLFSLACGDEPSFGLALDRFFGSVGDPLTLSLLGR